MNSPSCYRKPEENRGETVIEKIQNMLFEIMKENGWPVEVSIGAVTYLNAPTAADEVIKYADNLIYSVKSSGKNNLKNEAYGLEVKRNIHDENSNA